ncbi:MAG: hypothetical protein H0X30_28240 [Anaerolineae bacterium]|nr:hypothetical protein [Anaerolineae bacterium]
MNLRLVQFSLGTGTRSAAEHIADQIVPFIRSQPGCEQCKFFADYEAGDYGMVVLWASQSAANTAASVIGPVLTGLLTDAKVTTDNRRLFDVYEPAQK